MSELQDHKMAFSCANIIIELDALVFPGTPVEHMRIISAAPNPDKRESYFSYGSIECVGEYYKVFEKGIFKFVLELTTMRRYRFSFGRTEEETVMAIAGHEVRHRLQHRFFQIELFSPENAQKIPSLKSIANHLIGEYGNEREQFDAKIIEFLIIQNWHPNLSLGDVASLVRTEPKSLMKAAVRG